MAVVLVQAGDAHPPRGVEDGGDAGRQLDLDRGDVQRVAHRHLQRQRAVVVLVVVLRGIGLEAVFAAAQREDHRLVPDGADHVQAAAFDRGSVGEHLEGGSRLAGVGGCHVDLAARTVVVVAAHHGQHLAGLWIHGNQRAVVEVVVVPEPGDLASDDGLRQVLNVQIETGVDAVALTVAGADVVLLVQHLQHIVDEVRRLQLVRRIEELELLVLRRQRLRGRDHFLGNHGVEDFCLARLRPRRVDQRAVLRRRLRQPGKHGGLPQREVVRRGVEETAGRRLRAITLRSVIDGVEIQLKNLVLRVATVEIDGEHRLADLSLNRRWRVGPDEHLFDELLADRAPALGDVVMRVIGQRRARDTREVDAIVLVESLVLDRDGRLLDEGRHRVQRHHDAVVAMVADVVDEGAMTIENQHVLVKPGRGKPVDGRQVADRLGGEGGDHQQRKGQDQDRHQEKGAPSFGATLAPAEQPQAAVEGIAGETAARHSGRAGWEWSWRHH